MNVAPTKQGVVPATYSENSGGEVVFAVIAGIFVCAGIAYLTGWSEGFYRTKRRKR